MSNKKQRGAGINEGERTVRCTRVRICFDTELLISGKKVGEIEPQIAIVFENDFGKPIDLAVMAESVCSRVQEQAQDIGLKQKEK